MSENIVFNLDKIYLQDASIELSKNIEILHPLKSPQIDAKMNVNIDYETVELEQDLYRTIIKISAHAKIKDESIMILEAEQAGIFTIKNIPQDQMELVLNIECPNIVFPYVRETVSNLSTKAGFPPIILSAINFAHIYQQKKSTQSPIINSDIIQ
jgi:preprotein translocase subunit SecB